MIWRSGLILVAAAFLIAQGFHSFRIGQDETQIEGN